MLRQSMLGSDISYEDMMEDNELLKLYKASIIGVETIFDRDCHILQLKARTTRVTYQSRRLWVDSERYLPLKEERYAKSGKLLKTIQIVDVFKVGQRWYPKKVVFNDAMKKGKGTEYQIESIEFDASIPASTFSKAALRR